MRSPPQPKDTKEAILLAAGELFAHRGFDGVSVREIVARAGVTLSAVNYHFGGKESLYVETLRYVLAEKIQLERLFAELGVDAQRAPQHTSNVLCRNIHLLFDSYLAPEQPEWYGRLINRAVLDARPDTEVVFDEIVWPLHEALRKMLVLFVPAISQERADLWILSLFGQIHHYVMARRLILRCLGGDGDRYEEPFLRRAAAYVACGAIRALGLPMPEAAHCRQTPCHCAADLAPCGDGGALPGAEGGTGPGRGPTVAS